MCKPHTAPTGPYLRQLSDGLHCPLASQWSVWQKSDRHWSGYTSLEQRKDKFIQQLHYNSSLSSGPGSVSLQGSLGKNKTAVLHRPSPDPVGRLVQGFYPLPHPSLSSFQLSWTGDQPLPVCCQWEMWNFTFETVCSGRTRERLAASGLAVSVVRRQN